MLEQVSHIALDGVFRIWFDGKYTCFCWHGLPKDVHFTVSHRDEDEEVNLHITRNVKDAGNKPKIEIARISKANAEQLLKSLALLFLQYGLKEVKLKLPKGRHRKSSRHWFISFEKIQKHKHFTKFRDRISSAFRKASNVKGKKRLKISRTIEHEFESIVYDPLHQSTIFNSLEKLPRFNPKNKTTAGILFSKEYTGCIILAPSGIYEINKNPLPEILEKMISPDLYAELKAFIPYAIGQISNATSYRDTEHLDRKRRLIVISTDCT